MKKILVILIFLLAVCKPQTVSAFVVLLDPGHGGSELGAMGKAWNKKGRSKKLVNIYEKDLALSLAKRIKNILDKKHSVYLTRSFDRTVSLNDRAQLAEKIKADIFVSIHFNSSNENLSNGFETYYLDNHQDVAIKKVEDVENKYLDGAEKIVNQILIDLVIQKTVPSSKKLANKIHRKVNRYIGKRFKMKDRGVKPGLFYVLALSKRPGVLIEAGFISNSNELKVIRTNKFLNYYARAIADGIHDYLLSLPPQDLSLF